MERIDGQEVLNETLLRAELVAKLYALDKKDLDYLMEMFGEYEPKLESRLLLEYFINSINNAQKSDHWGHGKTVQIGYYADRQTYFTLIGHESGHDILAQLGREVGENFDWEEDFCHRFSRRVCGVLGLPYDSDLEGIGRQFHEICSEIRIRGMNNTLMQRLDNLTLNPKALILSFAPRARTQTFHWNNEGRPNLAMA